MFCMLNKVPNVNYEKCYPSRLKRIFRRDINYLTYKKFVPYTKNQIIGNIPIEVIKLFKEDKAASIKIFQKKLSNIANYLRGYYVYSKKQNIIINKFSDLSPEDFENFEKQITSFANKQLCKVLPKNISVDLKYTGKGAWGNVFHFSMSDKKGNKIMSDKALKIYHKKFGGVSCLSHMHGSCAEANFWTFMKFFAGHDLDKTQFTKHYISDLKNGYALTEFIDSKSVKNIFPLDLSNLFRLKYSDIMNTPMSGKFYDAGGFVKTFNFIPDKVTFKYFKKLMNRSPKELIPFMQRLQECVKNPKTPHRDKIQKAIELFKNQKQINNNIV
jgi:hypothetical protein